MIPCDHAYDPAGVCMYCYRSRERIEYEARRGGVVSVADGEVHSWAEFTMRVESITPIEGRPGWFTIKYCPDDVITLTVTYDLVKT